MTSRTKETHHEAPADGRMRSTKRFRTIKRRILRALTDRGIEVGDVQEFAAHDIALCSIVLEHQSDAVARGDAFDSEELNRLIRTRQLLLRRLGLTTDPAATRTSRVTGEQIDPGDMNLEQYVQQQDRRRERMASRYDFPVSLFQRSDLDIEALRKLRAEGDDKAIRKMIRQAQREAAAAADDGGTDDDPVEETPPPKRARGHIRRVTM